MLVEPPLESEERFPKADIDVGLRGGSELAGIVETAAQLMKSDGKLVFDLDAVSESVVDIEDGDGVIALVGIAVSDPPEVDLPVLVTGGFGVIGTKWRSGLRVQMSGGEGQEQRPKAERGMGSMMSRSMSEAHMRDVAPNK